MSTGTNKQPGRRPAHLQANASGSWKTVLEFDAGDDLASEQVQRGAEMLYTAAPNTGWRIVIPEGRSPIVLRHLGRGTYGIWMDAKYSQGEPNGRK